jgi:hypothetical protein
MMGGSFFATSLNPFSILSGGESSTSTALKHGALDPGGMFDAPEPMKTVVVNAPVIDNVAGTSTGALPAAPQVASGSWGSGAPSSAASTTQSNLGVWGRDSSLQKASPTQSALGLWGQDSQNLSSQIATRRQLLGS